MYLIDDCFIAVDAGHLVISSLFLRVVEPQPTHACTDERKDTQSKKCAKTTIESSNFTEDNKASARTSRR